MMKLCLIEALSLQFLAKTTHMGGKRYLPNSPHETVWRFTRRYLSIEKDGQQHSTTPRLYQLHISLLVPIRTFPDNRRI